jgi:hypothetical protein
MQEAVLGFLTIIHITFTPFCTDAETRYQTGWVYSGILLTSIGVFILSNLYDAFKSIAKHCLRIYLRCKRKVSKFMKLW